MGRVFTWVEEVVKGKCPSDAAALPHSAVRQELCPSVRIHTSAWRGAMAEEPEDHIAEDPRLRAVPSGAMALAGLTVGLLLLAWLLIYALVFLPRGMVGLMAVEPNTRSSSPSSNGRRWRASRWA